MRPLAWQEALVGRWVRARNDIGDLECNDELFASRACFLLPCLPSIRSLASGKTTRAGALRNRTAKVAPKGAMMLGEQTVRSVPGQIPASQAAHARLVRPALAKVLANRRWIAEE